MRVHDSERGNLVVWGSSDPLKKSEPEGSYYERLRETERFQTVPYHMSLFGGGVA
ncbi:MAG: hypothetical protein ACLPP9_03530 [Smithella sp.]